MLRLAPTAPAPPAGPSCALGNGPQVVHEWSGTVAPAVLVRTGANVQDTFSLPQDCVVSSVTVSIAWGSSLEDVDLAVTDPAGTVVRSQATNALSRSATEEAVVAPLAGTYTTVVSGFVNASTTFTGKVVAVVAGDAGAQPAADEPGTAELEPVTVPSDTGAARTVVAVLDSAINPYHRDFYAGGLYYPRSAPGAVTQEVLADLGALPVNDAAPWAQVGWGDLSAAPEKGVVAGALRALGVADLGKPAGFCDFQTGVVTVRKAYWDRVAPLAPAVTGERPPGAPAQDPFIAC